MTVQTSSTPTTGILSSIVSNLVTIECDGAVGQNEIFYINTGTETLMGEVIKITGQRAYGQVFESTRGLKSGMKAEFSGRLLEVQLGPGMLSKKYDGLQNDLDKMEGVFLKRGDYTDPLDPEVTFAFKPSAKQDDRVQAADWLGVVKENWIDHKIMVPFELKGDDWKISEIAGPGDYRVDDTIATLENTAGDRITCTMRQRWPVKLPVNFYREKVRPFKLMQMGVRAIDTLNPMLEGGTGFIPGPFGCGKTVLQHAMSKFAEADLIIIVACGERANEVVEIFTEFPELNDPRTGRSLMERTTIICNTSNMPVAAREASVYTGMTIAEYYRSMGLKVLLLADSTSRWAQALREMSNRLEELPGPDAFPMDLSAVISNFYSRAGFVYLNNGETGSITFVGTVSPAGGNLKEPVTEGTKKSARCFYALSQARADSKRYPAIDPLESYSKYLEYPEVRQYLNENIQPDWTDMVDKARDTLRLGQEARDQINILGDDSVPVDYHITFWKGELIDFTVLQQDAFDDIDSNTSLDRQKFMLNLVLDICNSSFTFNHYDAVSGFFKELINILKQMNYSAYESDKFKGYEKRLHEHTGRYLKKEPQSKGAQS